MAARIRQRAAAIAGCLFVPVLTPLVADAVVWSLLYTNRNGLIDSIIHGVFGVRRLNGCPTRNGRCRLSS